ncbi:excinuclease ABC subunit UvrA [Pectinatus cerevisiiphilus]|uniref:UvrABC system protein A n=1 Tax=Pectinatus cerevisiiphilus TaxID=86956 RepID=A0A4R3K4V0_9FIRM|nr:excinuclease ABC subunit UvrA [Pectinatus cerevisiiphilus]TCS77793.1 excinuclease ABC subunit A [Pectinatus cerevisiiphilus]
MPDSIKIKGARAHNLKNISLSIPRDKLVVITGLSGSGKSSLAFDTIYAEGQRRYVESLSSYARQFLGQMDKPDVDYIEGLSPAISIDQKTTSRNPRSTVGTVTEIYDYLRLLFARAGKPHCPNCGKPITQQTVDQILDNIMNLPEKTKLLIMAQVVRGKKGAHRKLLENIRKQGYVRVRVDNEILDINDEITLEKNKKHTIEVIVDRLTVRKGIESRLADSLETALKLGSDIVYVQIVDGELLMYSQNFACIDCGISLPEIAPRLFSFNSPYGACPKCDGLGSHQEFDLDLVMPNKNLTFAEGLFAPLSKNPASYAMCQIAAILKTYGYTLDTPWSAVKKDVQKIILYGTTEESFSFTYENMFGEIKNYDIPFEGVMPLLARRYKETNSDVMREGYEAYMSTTPCPLCGGARLKPEALAITIGDKNINEVTNMTIAEADKFFRELKLDKRQKLIASQILKEIHARLGFLLNVGLDYLTLGRAAGTLSGGEAQRIRLATQIGSGLTGVLYILDEPSIGLHQRDNNRLLATLKHLRDLGNTLIVVEHDEDTMYAADHIIDIGPEAGANGGRVVAQGTAEEIKKIPASITGQYMSRKKFIPVPLQRRKGNGKFVEIIGAAENNLKNIRVKFPLGTLTLVTGVSGSGKSTLVNEILYKGLAASLYINRGKPGKHKAIKGIENIDKIINIDQSPIGRTPRSNPATYTSVFDTIREVFSQTNEAKMRGYKPGRFSFNVKGGRCEACHGDGILKIEMHFLPDVYVPCEVCKGTRYNRETLEVKYKGKNISEVLQMVVDDAVEFFKNIPRLHRQLQILQDVGLGYIQLGQPATTLSGGEAQRVKLATELAKRSTGRTLYILDEPTTGLHTADIHKLLDVLQRLVDNGDTVVVIEHNLDVIKTADYIIDLGPEGGDKGGTIVAKGTPEQIVQVKESYTGQFLAPVLAEGIKLTKRIK